MEATSSRKRSRRENLDRFIPNRSAMDFGFAHCMLTQAKKRKENPALLSTRQSREAYRKRLAEALGVNRTRILAFRNKTLAPKEPLSPPLECKSSKPMRDIPRHPQKILDAPDLIDDFSINVLDWGSSNVLTIALGNTVYLWNSLDGSTSELVTVDEEDGPVASVSWASNGRHLAIGLNNSHVQIWDSTTSVLLRTIRDGHQAPVGSLAWNNHILTSGGMNGQIINNDVRVRFDVVQTYKGHQQEVCGLKWSDSGQQLASAGKDNLIHIWDRSMASSNSTTRWLHRLAEHRDGVRALAWCPFQRNLLASGGGDDDRCIKFWNTCSGACVNSVGTGSQVCALLWNKNERELLSSHGLPHNQIALWKYPSMLVMSELTGHTSSVLYMAESPNGCAVASAAADEKLQIWNVFGNPEVTKPVPKASLQRFAYLNLIR